MNSYKCKQLIQAWVALWSSLEEKCQKVSASMCSSLLQLNSLTSAPQDPKLHLAKAELNRSLKGQFIQMAKKHFVT